MADVSASFKQIRDGVNGLIDAAEGAVVHNLPVAAGVAVAFNPNGREMVGQAAGLAGDQAKLLTTKAKAEIRANVQEVVPSWAITWIVMLLGGPILGTLVDGPVKWYSLLVWFMVCLALQVINMVKLQRTAAAAGFVLGAASAIPKTWGGPADTLFAFIRVLKGGGEGSVDAMTRLYHSMINERFWYLVCCGYLAAGHFTRLAPLSLAFPAFSAIGLFILNSAGPNNYDVFGRRLIAVTGHKGYTTTLGPDGIVSETYKPVDPTAQVFFRWVFILTCAGFFLASFMVGETSVVAALTHPNPAQQEVWLKFQNFTNHTRWATEDSTFRVIFRFWFLPVLFVVVVVAGLFGARWWKSPGFMCFIMTLVGWIWMALPLWFWASAMFLTWLVINRSRNKELAQATH